MCVYVYLNVLIYAHSHHRCLNYYSTYATQLHSTENYIYCFKDDKRRKTKHFSFKKDWQRCNSTETHEEIRKKEKEEEMQLREPRESWKFKTFPTWILIACRIGLYSQLYVPSSHLYLDFLFPPIQSHGFSPSKQ